MLGHLKHYTGIGAAGLCLLLLITHPQAAAEAVKGALGVCAGLILPSLLPFFFLSGIMSALGIPEMLATAAGRAMVKLFGASPHAAAPLFLGLLGGYPVGAAALAEAVREEKLSAREASRLLSFCNNTGPAFIIGAVGGGIFSSVAAGLLLCAVHILAAFTLGIISRENKADTECIQQKSGADFGVSVLPAAVRGATEKCVGICGFVVFFSILNALLEELGLVSACALFINSRLGLEIGFCRSLLAGIMELGGGIASMAGMELCRQNLSLAAFILGFGSLSVHCQTLSVISGTEIKCARHFAGRILHGLLSALYTLLLFPLLRI